MLNYDDILEALQASNWPDPVKQELTPIIPRLGKWALSFLSQQINSTGGEFAADDNSEIISFEPQWYDDLQNNRADQIITTTQNIIDSDDELNHKALLAVILDIRSNKAVSALVTQELSRLFDQVEIRYLKNLPVGEVVSIISTRINRIYEQADLQMEIKRYCYYIDSLAKDDVEVIAFKQALENNDQPIGAQSKSIKKWINDFMQSAASVVDRSVYNVAHFMTNDPEVKKLTNAEKVYLAEVLKLYNWLFQPTATAKEIESYEAHRLYAKPTIPQAPVAAPRQNATSPLTSSSDLDDMIKGVPRQKMGVVKDPTNIKIAEEKQRLDLQQSLQQKKIQQKLSDLRTRHHKKQ